MDPDSWSTKIKLKQKSEMRLLQLMRDQIRIKNFIKTDEPTKQQSPTNFDHHKHLAGQIFKAPQQSPVQSTQPPTPLLQSDAFYDDAQLDSKNKLIRHLNRLKKLKHLQSKVKLQIAQDAQLTNQTLSETLLQTKDPYLTSKHQSYQ